MAPPGRPNPDHHYLYFRASQKEPFGILYFTPSPVNVLEFGAQSYIVAPRGYTQWVRNVATNGEAALLKGRRRQRVRLRPVSDAAKPEILKVYSRSRRSTRFSRLR